MKNEPDNSFEYLKRHICYRLCAADTDLPSIPYFDMAISFYLMFYNSSVHVTDHDLSSHTDSVGIDADADMDTGADDKTDKPKVDIIKDAIDDGIFDVQNGCLIAPVDEYSLKLWHCTVDDLLPIAQDNTPIMNPSVTRVIASDGVLLETTSGLYSATAMLYKSALTETASVLGDNFLLLPISEKCAICTNGLSIDHAKDLIRRESTLTKHVYQYLSGEISTLE